MNIIYILSAILLLLFAGTKIYRKKRTGKRIVSISEANCSRCGSCVRKCRRGVLELRNSENGKQVVVANPDLCTGCGHCMEVCRFNAIEMIRP
jgi:NAD-dependent dihydropyrimidine dehydrogenase PreA subunit